MSLDSILTGFCAGQTFLLPSISDLDTNQDLIQKYIFDGVTFNASLAFQAVTIAKNMEKIDSSRFFTPSKVYLTASIISCIYSTSIALEYANLNHRQIDLPTPLYSLPNHLRFLNAKCLPIAILTLALYGSYHNINRKHLFLTIGTMVSTLGVPDKSIFKANQKYNNIPYFLSLITWAGSVYFNHLKQ